MTAAETLFCWVSKGFAVPKLPSRRSKRLNRGHSPWSPKRLDPRETVNRAVIGFVHHTCVRPQRVVVVVKALALGLSSNAAYDFSNSFFLSEYVMLGTEEDNDNTKNTGV